MNTNDNTHVESLFERQVIEVGSLANAGKYSQAISTIRNAKAIYPKNIFIIALEKQLEKLLAFTYSPALTDPDRQNEILGSIPTLTQRAVEAMSNEGPLPTSLPIHHSKERDAAFKNLKEQYFQLADAQTQKREYRSALEEIRRVLILDPDDGMAKEYERKIKEFIDLEETSAQVTRNSTQREKESRLDPQPPQPSKERVVPKTNQPVRQEQEKVAEEQVQRQRQTQRMNPLSRTLLAVGISVFLVALTVTYFSLWAESTESASAITAPVVNESVPSKNTEPTVTKTELDQPAPRVLPDSQASSNANDLDLTQEVQPGAGTATVSSSDASERISLPLNGTSEPSSRSSGVSSDVARPSIEPSKAVAEQQPVVLANPKAEELAQRQEQKVSDLKTPTLAKLEVRSATPTNNSKSEAPPSIAYIERKPEIIRLVNPKFPTAAWDAGVEGEVVVKVQIGTDGKPIQAKIVKSSSELFNDAVIEAVLNSQYSPRIMSTGAVTTWLQLPFTFKRKAN